MLSIYEFTDYKDYLNAIEKERSSIQRGFRSRLAEVLSCQNAYVSQVLNTHANFSLEQGFEIATFLKLNQQETRYFMLLLEFSRAGTEELKQYFLLDIRKMREKNLDLKDKLKGEAFLKAEDQNVYYSSWIYPAIHMLTTIQGYQSTQSIATALRLEAEVVEDVVLFLVETGLLEKKSGKLTPGGTQIHLSKDSPLIRQHHNNWRVRAVQSLASELGDAIHYSTVSSLSKKDAEKLKLMLVDVIQQYVATVAPSKEETLYNFNLDFYSLIR